MKKLTKFFNVLLLISTAIFMTACDPIIAITGGDTPVENPDNGNGTGGNDNGQSSGESGQTAQPVENAVLTIDYTKAKKDEAFISSFGDVTFDFAKSTKVYDGNIRLYKGGTLSISAENEITKIQISAKSSNKGNIQSNVGTCKDNLWEGNSKKITFTNSGNVAYIEKIIITYTGTTRSLYGTGNGGSAGGNEGGESGGTTGGETVTDFPEDTRDLSALTQLNIDFSAEKDVFTKFGDCNFAWEKNSGSDAPKYDEKSKDARLYKKNSLTISSTSTISKILIEFSAGHAGTFTVTPEKFYTSGDQALWMGEAKSITFTNTRNYAGIKKMTIWYTGKAATASGNVRPEPTEIKESDWLFLYYYDADNNLNDELYTNLKEAEYSLSQLRNEDGTPKEGCPNINMVMLWDGLSTSDASYYKQNGYKFTHWHANGAVFELGADNNLEFEAYDDSDYGAGFVKIKGTPDSDLTDSNWYPLGKQFELSDNTVEYRPSWLKTEPDMSDPDTLKNFLTWAKQHYSAKNVVICMSDHGSGTGKETYVNTNTRKIVSKTSRTLCTDDNADTGRELSCKNIVDALEAAGYTGADKPSVIWMDVCLQSTVEIANLLAGKADYLLASPDLSVSHEYSHAFTTFKDTMTPEIFCKTMVSEYHHNYYDYQYPYDGTNVSGTSMLTMSSISLDETKQAALKTSLESFADVLLAYKAANNDGFKSMYKNYIMQRGNYSDCKGIAYEGTYSVLYDIGALVTELTNDSALKTAMPGLEAATEKVKSALEDVIVYSWGGKRGITYNSKTGEWTKLTDNQMYLHGGIDYLTGKTIAVEKPGDFYGLTIVTQSIETSISESLKESAVNMATNYYKYTGYSEKWQELLCAFPDLSAELGGDDNGDSGNTSSDLNDPEEKEESPAPTADAPVKSDWLFIYYYDADNNLNDELYRNMREAEYSLKMLRKEDGITPKDGCPSVNMLMLWDGASKTEMSVDNLTYFHENAALYELGAGTELEYAVYSDSEWQIDEPNQFNIGYVYDSVNTTQEQRDQGYDFGDTYRVSANTKEFTKQAAWLEEEPDMSDYQLLSDYLKWVNERYQADNVVICLSDHGAGTGKEVYIDTTSESKTADGRAKRTLCMDDTSDNGRLLTCRNINDALTDAGYTGANKPKMIWMDVCLQSTIEIASLLADSADYLLASPNISISHNYADALPLMTNNTTAADLGKLLVSEYYHENFFSQYPYDGTNASGASMLTMSLISLDGTKINTLNNGIEALADKLLEIEKSNPTTFKDLYKNWIMQGDDYNKCINRSLSYSGSYAYLTDIGSMTEKLAAADSANFGTIATTIQNALDDVIVAAYGSKRGTEVDESAYNDSGDDIDWNDPDLWDDDEGGDDYYGEEGGAAWKTVTENQMYYKGGVDFISNNTVPVEWTNGIYGLTIVTQSSSTADEDYGTEADNTIITDYVDQTGYSSKWGQVISAWAK